MDFCLKMDEGMKNLSSSGAFLTVKSADGKLNTMTISWGFIGYIWENPYFITVVRPQRYTYDLLKNAESFTISIPFNSDLKNELKICGTKSGRILDKSKVVEFIDSKSVASPVVKGCGIYYECKVEYRQEMDGDAMPEKVAGTFFKNRDFHKMFFGKIVECY